MRFVLMTLLCGLQITGQSLTVDKLELHNVTAGPVTYQGRTAVRVADADKSGEDSADRMAIVKGTVFEDGTIDVWLSGDTAPNAPAGLRGFVGIAFRVVAEGSQYECIYLRPKNGRSEDQLQRNHSAQYISVPGYPWEKLRQETPGKYESYVDLVPGKWTHVQIRVNTSSARLHVDGSAEPTLIVNDLKQTPVKGAVALWLGPGTIAHFSELKITK
jgi:hypothetical protein